MKKFLIISGISVAIFFLIGLMLFGWIVGIYNNEDIKYKRFMVSLE